MMTTMEAPTTTYEETRKRHQAHFFQQLGPHLDRLGWSADRLRAERERRLRALLAVARERSEWHRERLAQVDVASCTEGDLARIPPMTKSDLMANFDRIVTDPRVTLDLANQHVAGLTRDAYLLDEHHAIASGGSSGKRGVFVYDWNGWADWTLLCLRYLLRLRQPAPATAGEPVTAVVMADVASHGSSASPQCFRDAFAGSRLVRLASSLPMDEIVRGLNQSRPAVLMAYPSILAQLAAAARRGELHIAPRLICTSAEPLLPEIRAAAQAQWGAAIVNMWGTSEGGAIACGCGAGSGMHLSDDLLIVEPVDAEGKPVGPGERSAKIYLTNLFNHALPLIRYELSDEVTLATRSCLCGSAHRLVEDVQGRLEDRFVYPGLPPMHSLLFHTVLDPKPGIVEYQVRQTANGAEVDVVRSGPADLDRIARDLEAALAKAGVQGPAVTVREVSRIARPASGKLKRFVPLP
jgi:phenylacetate-CoA ligase